MKEADELTYDQAAAYLDCSPRHVRRVLKRAGIKSIKRGYRTIRFRAGDIFRLKFKLATEPRQEVITVRGHKYKLMLIARSNGKAHR